MAGNAIPTPLPFLYQNLHGADPETERRGQETEKWLDYIGAQIVNTTTNSTAGTVVTSTVFCLYPAQLVLSGFITNGSSAQTAYFTIDGTSTGPAFTIPATETVSFGYTSTALTPAGRHTVTIVAAASYTAGQLTVDRRRPISYS